MTASANAPVLALLEEGDPRCGAEMKRPKPPSEATEDLARSIHLSTFGRIEYGRAAFATLAWPFRRESVGKWLVESLFGRRGNSVNPDLQKFPTIL